ncbi:MAG: class I SAM-dependent methyltransferase, partial [Anaerolineales bacterium]|nr:class I SAM-dependent methyltransferase [Anaerolineales bacterium]
MLKVLLEKALAAREKDFRDFENLGSLRLFNGFYEGQPGLVADLYGRTLVLFDYGKVGDKIHHAADFYRERLPNLKCGIIKSRSGGGSTQKKGILAFGDAPNEKIRENGVWYALDLQMQQDASFYLDTRKLRTWLRENANEWTVLNTFAYTGSLGVAALAGGAAHAFQTDRNRKFLDLARRSAALNHFDLGKMKTQAGDFFSVVAGLKKQKRLFDCVILDPPFFSSTAKGTIDFVNESTRLINKVRPLIRDGGYLVAINNALFLSGVEYMHSLEALCVDG